jgi:type VI secretion system protein
MVVNGEGQGKLMTLTLRVTSYRGAPLPASLVAQFDENGGSIGRAPECHFCLPDTDKLISRNHASVKYRSGQFFILDHGGNPLIHNNNPLGDGREALLADGDELALGEYRISVEWIESEIAAVARASSAPLMKEESANPMDFSAEPLGDMPSANLGYDPFDPDEILPLGNGKLRERPPMNAGASMRNDLPGYAQPIPKTITKNKSIDPPDYDPWRDDASSAEPDIPNEPNVAAEQFDSVEAILPAARTPGSQKTPTPRAAPSAAPQAPMPEKPAPIASQGKASQDAILKALLKGLGATHFSIPNEQPERLAETLGAMLREALEGTMDLLRARAASKRENRMDQTMISSMENNPLKFFPNVDEALLTMLTRNSGAYLAPVAAVNEAFDDMRAHELATVTGMRAAFGDLLKRFDPQAIERSEEASALDGILPPLKKARMWNRMNVIYRELVRESEDNFDKVFGASFVRAYADQVRRLRAAAERKGRK